MGKVVERIFYITDGHETFKDVPRTYEWADKRHGSRLDRRKNYAYIKGGVCEAVSWSQACSGCYEGYHLASANGSGCHECGYTGRTRCSMWVPVGSISKDEDL